MSTIKALTLLFLFGGMTAYVVMIFNGLIGLKNDIDKAWANIDVLLKQRHDELSKLLEVCKGYMNYEHDTLVQVTQARNLYQQAITPNQKIAAGQSMGRALQGFFAVAENYPALQADNNFMQLQKRITEIEGQIADRREFYNDSVNSFNTRIEQIPDTFIASFMNLRPRPMFQVQEADKADVPMAFGANAGS
jgi:LemA protein